MTNTSSHDRKNVVGIQYARGVAALLVVLYHVASQMQADVAYGRMPHRYFDFGYIGVPIFFVISGFIIAIVSLDDALRPRISINEFIRKRALRILPFMWLAIIAYNLLSFIGTQLFDWASFTRAMILWPSGTVKPNVIWTLRHEALFYMLFALSFLAWRRHLWLISLWCIAPVIISIFSLGSVAPEGNPSFFTLLFSDVNIMFGAGLLLGLYARSYPSNMQSSWSGGAITVYLGAAALAAVAWLMNWRSGFSASVYVTFFSTFLIFCAARLAPSNSFFDRAAVLIGDASYAIYLVHNIVIVPALIAGRNFVGGVGIWPLFVSITTVAVLVGVLAHVLVEKPMLSIINRLLSRRQENSSNDSCQISIKPK